MSGSIARDLSALRAVRVGDHAKYGDSGALGKDIQRIISKFKIPIDDELLLLARLESAYAIHDPFEL
jgi:hypothetical protein